MGSVEQLSSGDIEADADNSSTEWLIKTQLAANPPPISSGDTIDYSVDLLREGQLVSIADEAICR